VEEVHTQIGRREANVEVLLAVGESISIEVQMMHPLWPPLMLEAE
jgi:uncharacterized PurR-regulated membrane protein YhhQ (DUF165 family)